ncbi:EG45-like domain containing protein [Pistacia vera]|uniref:EG45-like domain containing protein n=1 Tax=Pistacia vera TaxID=55513 RepID=UPI001262D841|nr:EG45-like domain containing protein [Pistacia vera]
MGIEMKAFLILSMAMSLISVAFAATGTATYYTTYVPSACNGYQNDGDMIAAASNVLWNNGAVCNKYYRITCTGLAYQGANPCKSGSVVVKIVDHCPTGCTGTIDLSEQAFAKIANTAAGKINIQYTPV